MRLTELDAKEYLISQGIPCSRGVFLPFSALHWPKNIAWEGPVYLKAQVLQGRRGEKNLVCRCLSPEGIERNLEKMRKQVQEGNCAGFVCESEVIYRSAYLLACDIDRSTGKVRFHVSEQGGSEVSHIHTWFASSPPPGTIPVICEPILERLAQALTTLDALSIEINPFVELMDGTGMALDAKVELDEAAAFRHPEWKTLSSLSRWGEWKTPCEQAYRHLRQSQDRSMPSLGSYIECEGDIATIFAGGGASLLAMDSLVDLGGRMANYLELSGNPDPVFLKRAAAIVFSRPGIRAVWIAGSFANFTDIQLTVRAILEALEESGLRVPVCIRRDGPGVEQAQQEAKAWAQRYGVPLMFHQGDVSLRESAHFLLQSLA